MPIRVKALSISEINDLVCGQLEHAFPAVWVAGEISNFSLPNSGHAYLTLKDQKAQLNCFVWKETVLRFRHILQDGLEIFARGKLTVYPPRGSYQLLIDDVRPKGFGARELALRDLREKLKARGWFDPSRKKPIPVLPRKIAIVTSLSGAAITDMTKIIPRRWPVVEVLICPVPVQGDDAAGQIADMIRRVHLIRPAPDVMIVGRGGGSLEDLWPFNEEVLARAILDSRIPIISAVGHENDRTIADAVADRRAATPSEAAELVVPDRAEIFGRLRMLAQRLARRLRVRANSARQELNSLKSRQVLRDPLNRVRMLAQMLDRAETRLGRAQSAVLERSRLRLAALVGRLQAMSPLNVLARGYSLTKIMGSQELLTQASKTIKGDLITTLLSSGQILSRVEEIQAAS